MHSIRAMHDGLLRAPLTTVVVRGREGGGGEDDLEPPAAAAWATAAAPAVFVRRDHHHIIVLLSAPTPLPSTAASTRTPTGNPICALFYFAVIVMNGSPSL